MIRGFENAAACWKVILSDVWKNRGLLSVIEAFARDNCSPVRVVFGTSGWRGEIGSDYTFNNVRIVTSAIIAMFKEADPGADVFRSGGGGFRKKGGDGEKGNDSP